MLSLTSYFFMYLRQKRKKWRQILFMTSIDRGKLKPISRMSFSNLGKTDVGEFNPKQKNNNNKKPFFWKCIIGKLRIGELSGLVRRSLWRSIMIQVMMMWSPMAIMMRHMSVRTCHPTWIADMAESLNLPTVLIPSVNTTHYLIGYCKNSK